LEINYTQKRQVAKCKCLKSKAQNAVKTSLIAKRANQRSRVIVLVFGFGQVGYFFPSIFREWQFSVEKPTKC